MTSMYSKLRLFSSSLARLVMVLAICNPLAVSAQVSKGQLETELKATWLVSIDGDPKTRTLIIKALAEKSPDLYMVDANYGLTDGRQGPIKVEIKQNGAERKLSLETQANSSIEAIQDSSGVFRGYFTGRSGKPRKVMIEKMTEAQLLAGTPQAPAGQVPPAPKAASNEQSAALGSSTAQPASASPEGGFLPKTEVQALVSGKKWKFNRVSDGHSILWDLREGGALFANNYTVTGSDSGTWLVNDNGQVCVKWRGRSNDVCVALIKDGASFKMFLSTNLKVQSGTLTIE